MNSDPQLEINQASESFKKADSGYKRQLGRYSVSLLAAELALIGFLLQDASTRGFIAGPIYKFTLICSLLFSLMTILLLLLTDRCTALKNKYAMWLTQHNIVTTYTNVVVPPFNVPANKELVNSFATSKQKYMEKFVFFSKWDQELPSYAEYSFALASVFAVIFVVWLVVSI